MYSNKVRAGKRRTYFFDVRQTKGDDYYLTLTESTKRFNDDGYERHKIFLYKEDFNRFMDGLEAAVNYVKTELMPDYDYDEYTRRHEEWEANRKLEENQDGTGNNSAGKSNDDASDDDDSGAEETKENSSVETEDDISW